MFQDIALNNDEVALYLPQYRTDSQRRVEEEDASNSRVEILHKWLTDNVFAPLCQFWGVSTETVVHRLRVDLSKFISSRIHMRFLGKLPRFADFIVDPCKGVPYNPWESALYPGQFSILMAYAPAWYYAGKIAEIVKALEDHRNATGNNTDQDVTSNRSNVRLRSFREIFFALLPLFFSIIGTLCILGLMVRIFKVYQHGGSPYSAPMVTDYLWLLPSVALRFFGKQCLSVLEKELENIKRN